MPLVQHYRFSTERLIERLSPMYLWDLSLCGGAKHGELTIFSVKHCKHLLLPIFLSPLHEHAMQFTVFNLIPSVAMSDAVLFFWLLEHWVLWYWTKNCMMDKILTFISVRSPHFINPLFQCYHSMLLHEIFPLHPVESTLGTIVTRYVVNMTWS